MNMHIEYLQLQTCLQLNSVLEVSCLQCSKEKEDNIWNLHLIGVVNILYYMNMHIEYLQLHTCLQLNSYPVVSGQQCSEE